MSEELLESIQKTRDIILDEIESLRSEITNLKFRKSSGKDTTEHKIIKPIPKQIAIRMGIDIMFSYPCEDEGYDQIISCELNDDAIIIVERSKELKSTRTHQVRRADIVSWV